jgi:histidyl-tRNA synthetase
MNDLLPPDSAKTLAFERACRELFELYGYREIRTPILEPTELFSRGVGETTDVVEKQMYTFADRKGRSLTMRPELTASCVRAYIQHAVSKREPATRWYYLGPMFRYEKVQTGRYRQFHQVGVEALGVAEPTVEAEQIAMLIQLYERLGIGGLEVEINSVGRAEDRAAYRAALLEHLRPHAGELCGDCQRRLEKNPLRVLDCKIDGGGPLIEEAPSILEYLAAGSRAHFDAVQAILAELSVPYRVAPRMVRGLDYYTATVFEIISHSNNLGAQATLVAGGRYDGLVEMLGGPPTPAVGFAAGIERNVLCMAGDADEYERHPTLFLAPLGEEARRRAASLARELRGAGVHVELEHREVGAKAQLKRADKVGAAYVAVIGSDELATGAVDLKRMADGATEKVAFADLAGRLSGRGDGA